jgi:ADP-ribose pyrophosphatase
MGTVFEGKHIIVVERDGWEYVERRSATTAAAVVATTADDAIVLTEQFRRAVDARVIDLPAGLVGDEDGSDDAAAAAKRELEEETGYTCSSVELLQSGPTSPGITSETVSLFRARDVRRTGAGGGVGGESIEVHVVPRAEVVTWLEKKQRDGRLIDLKVWIALYFLATSAIAATPSRLGELSWMAGHWSGNAGGVSMEEWWTSGKGGLMLAVHRDVTAKGTHFEFLRIEEKDGAITYLASPQGQPGTPFPLKELSTQRVVFENPTHDFPQRIIYWRKGASLCARVEGMMNGKVEGEESCWKK